MRFFGKCFKGKFGNFITDIEKIFDKLDKSGMDVREMKHTYLELKKNFDELQKKAKSDNSCTTSNGNNNNKNKTRKNKNEDVKYDKKVEIISLLLILFKDECDLKESNYSESTMIRVNDDLHGIQAMIKDANTTVNSVKRGEKIVSERIRKLAGIIEDTMKLKVKMGNVNTAISREREFNRTMKQRLNRLKEGGRRRKTRSKA